MVNYKTGKVHAIHALADPAAEQPPTDLTKREKQVLELIRDGKLSKEISETLFISVHTVNTHRQRILGKLNANNSHEAVRFASAMS